MISIDFHVNKKDLYLFALMLFFIFVTYIFANFVVMRDLDEYIDKKNKLLFQQTLQKYIKQNAQDAMMQYQSYKKYEPYLLTMSQDYEIKSLRSLLSHYFVVKDVKLLEQSKEKLLKSRYELNLVMESPKRFFIFLQDINKKAYPFKLEYPLRFEKADDKVAATLYLSIYTFR